MCLSIELFHLCRGADRSGGSGKILLKSGEVTSRVIDRGILQK